MSKLNITSSLKLLLAAITLGFIASCSVTTPLSPEQISELSSSFNLEDQDPAQFSIRGPVTIEISEEILGVFNEAKSSFDTIDLYISQDAAADNFVDLAPVVSLPLEFLTSGLNTLGDVPFATPYNDGDLLIMTLANSENDKAAKKNPINSGVSLAIYDYVAVQPSDTSVKTVEEPVEQATVVTPQVIEIEPDPEIELDPDVQLSNVMFDFDKSEIKAEYAEQLAAELEEFSSSFHLIKVYIAGHADERGTQEYNLALGERRADAVKRFLIGLGFSSSNILTVSFGEERPLDPASNDAAWSANRRAEVAIQRP